MTLPLAVTDMVQGVVWLPARVRQTPLGALLGAGVGHRMQVGPALISSAEGHGA